MKLERVQALKLPYGDQVYGVLGSRRGLFLSASKHYMCRMAPDDYNESHARSYRIFGVPFRTGSLYPGSENDAQPYRDAGLQARLEAAGCHVVDQGDVAIPSYLPHHTMPAAYFPHDDGVTLKEATDLMDVLLKDDRIRIIEVTEYAALRDLEQQSARQLVELLATGLSEKERVPTAPQR